MKLIVEKFLCEAATEFISQNQRNTKGVQVMKNILNKYTQYNYSFPKSFTKTTILQPLANQPTQRSRARTFTRSTRSSPTPNTQEN